MIIMLSVKNNLLKSILIASLFWCCNQVLFATDFKVGKLGFTIIEGSTNVSVSSFDSSVEPIIQPGEGEQPEEADAKRRRTAASPQTYSLVIPQTVSYNDVTYTVVAIDAAVFSNRVQMAEVSIPETVTRIGDKAFQGCTALKKVICHIESPLSLNAENKVFDGVDQANCELVVFKSSQSAYTTADIWKEFKFDSSLRDFNISYISSIVDYLLEEETPSQCIDSLDANNDGSINLYDIEYILNKVLGK